MSRPNHPPFQAAVVANSVSEASALLSEYQKLQLSYSLESPSTFRIRMQSEHLLAGVVAWNGPV